MYSADSVDAAGEGATNDQLDAVLGLTLMHSEHSKLGDVLPVAGVVVWLGEVPPESAGDGKSCRVMSQKSA